MSEPVNLATAVEFHNEIARLHGEIARLRLTDAERSAIKEASEFYIGTRTGVALGGLLERLK